MPSSSANRVSSDDASALRDVQQPADRGRLAAGLGRGLVDRGVSRGQVARPGGRTGSAASRPPCGRPGSACAACTRRSRSGCRAPARVREPRRRAGSRTPSKRAGSGCPTSQSDRITSIASSSASTLCPGVSRRPPIASIPSQNAPAPSPSSDASTAQDVEARDGARDDRPGRASGRLRTFARDAHAARARGDEREQRPGVEEPRLVGVVLEGDEVEPDRSASVASATTEPASWLEGVMKTPNSRACP